MVPLTRSVKMTLLSINLICDPAVLVQSVTSLKKKITSRPASFSCSRLAAQNVLDLCSPIREVRASVRQQGEVQTWESQGNRLGLVPLFFSSTRWDIISVKWAGLNASAASGEVESTSMFSFLYWWYKIELFSPTRVCPLYLFYHWLDEEVGFIGNVHSIVTTVNVAEIYAQHKLVCRQRQLTPRETFLDVKLLCESNNYALTCPPFRSV